MDWDSAKSFCTSLNEQAYLIEIFNSNQQDFVEQKGQELGIYGNLMWTGLTYVGSSWYWDNSQKKADFFKWESSSFSSIGSSTINRIRLCGDWKWHPRPRSSSHYPICQYKS